MRVPGIATVNYCNVVVSVTNIHTLVLRFHLYPRVTGMSRIVQCHMYRLFNKFECVRPSAAYKV
jgi:hypothetical protein